MKKKIVRITVSAIPTNVVATEFIIHVADLFTYTGLLRIRDMIFFAYPFLDLLPFSQNLSLK